MKREQKVNNCPGAYRRHQRETQGGALVGLAFWQQASFFKLPLYSGEATTSLKCRRHDYIIPSIFYVVIVSTGIGLDGARQGGWVGDVAPPGMHGRVIFDGECQCTLCAHIHVVFPCLQFLSAISFTWLISSEFVGI